MNSRETRIQKVRDFVRQFNKHFFNKITLKFAGHRGSPFSIVKHRGRKTGKSYSTPVVTIRTEDRFYIPLTYGENVDWLKNVLHASDCIIQSRGDSILMTMPQVVNASNAIIMFPQFQRKLFRFFRVEKFLEVRQLNG
jgi:deazaflavin-dependent oxidoreductase (nitroreductase family)